MAVTRAPSTIAATRAAWEEAWPRALDAWSRFTRLRAPIFCESSADAAREGLTESFAMIRLADQAIVIDLESVLTRGLSGYPIEIMAHEIGHHILAPATLSDHARMIARMRHALPTLEAYAPQAANLYTDLLINDRLQRGAELRMADVYRQLGRHEGGSKLWSLYMRMYEHLWRLDRGTLVARTDDAALEGDAILGMRVVRSYARDWLAGSGRFAALLLPYLLDDREKASSVGGWHDTRDAAAGAIPGGLAQEDPDERAGAVHPAADAELSDTGEGEAADVAAPSDATSKVQGRGQAREPFEYGAILKAAGVALSDHDIAVRYYRERAAPLLVPFPRRERPESDEPQAEGLEPWDIGSPIDMADWFQSVIASPRVIPGMTTVQRVWGRAEAAEPAFDPVDLDLYVDCSGSMPNPQTQISYTALAGAILCLSALRVGARVQVTLWSGARQFDMTPGFVRDERSVLRVLTGYFGGGTAFPIHVLRDTYAKRKRNDRPVHIVVLSDDGVTTMFDRDEHRASGWDIAAMALARARGGGTLVLNIPLAWETAGGYYGDLGKSLRRARDQLGWRVHAVASWENLVDFARAFSRDNYQPAPVDHGT